MKKLTCIIVGLACAVSVLHAQQTLVVDRFLQKMDQSTLRSAFSLTIGADVKRPEVHSGRMTIRGRQFFLSVAGVDVSYDGAAYYTYLQQSKEMTIEKPTEDELSSANPLLFARSMRKVCKVQEKVSGKNTVVTLVPADQTVGIQQFVLTIETATLLPVSVYVKEGANYTKLTFTKPKYSTDKPVFKMVRKGATVTDLR